MRSLSLVRLTEDWIGEDVSPRSIFRDPVYLYLGEIPNMPGHGVFIGRDTGKIYPGFHIERFRELTDEEL